jgi:hypothetical protein
MHSLVNVFDGAADLDEPGPDGVLGKVLSFSLSVLDARCQVALVRILGHDAPEHVSGLVRCLMPKLTLRSVYIVKVVHHRAWYRL